MAFLASSSSICTEIQLSLGNPGCDGAAAAVVELRQAYFEVGIALYSEANEGQFLNVIIFVMLNNIKAIR